MKIGIVGYGSYGKLLHALIRRFALFVDVLIFDPKCPPDGRVFVEIGAMTNCDGVIFAVPMDAFEVTVRDFLLVPGLRPDMVLVNVCSDQSMSGATLTDLAGSHPVICAHSPWGPEAYRLVDEVVSRLPAIVVTHWNLEGDAWEKLGSFMRERGFRVAHNSAEEHDRVLAGQQMYVTHMNSQILQLMQMIDGDCSNAPLSFQDLVSSASAVRNDRELFFDLWHRVPECQTTFERYIAAVHELERLKNEHVNGE